MTDRRFEQRWWERGIVYEIYPRSFQDSNGDGIGDLPGIIARLDYLAWLGVDAIWLAPFYPSPMADFGYDVSDYTNVAAIFGSLDDFDRLLDEAHRRGLKVIIDYVPNHTSDRHEWFRASRSSRHAARRNWYIWQDPSSDGGPPNNWLSEFGGPAWSFDQATGQYYYHAYLASQPDLNWRNSDVRAAMLDVLRFWLERGVDGFRIDTVHHLFEDTQLRDNPPDPDWRPGMPPTQALQRRFTVDQPEIHEVLAEFRRIVDAYGARVLISEAYLPLDRVVAYYGAGLAGVHLPFNFHLIGARWDAGFLAALITRYESLLPPGAWPNWVLGNHDRSRVASRLGAAQARLAAMLLLTLRGTPTLYYGDELGMTDVAIPAALVQDPWEKNLPGLGLGRDPVRTPMRWSDAPGGGFSSAAPWLPLGAELDRTNVAAQRRERGSMLDLYRRLIDLRRREPALSIGGYSRIDHAGDVLLYERREGVGRVLVCLNLADRPAVIELPISGEMTILLSSGADRDGEKAARNLTLRPAEGVVAAPARD
jgi:alpha-glucosidase